MDASRKPQETPKRGPGRPKGSKNKPSAGNVGRPRKDGRPPQKRSKDALATPEQPEQPAARSLSATAVDAAKPGTLNNEDNCGNVVEFWELSVSSCRKQIMLNSELLPLQLHMIAVVHPMLHRPKQAPVQLSTSPAVFLRKPSTWRIIRKSAILPCLSVCPQGVLSRWAICARRKSPSSISAPATCDVNWHMAAQDNPYVSDVNNAQSIYILGGEYDDQDDQELSPVHDEDLDDEFQPCGDDDFEEEGTSGDAAPPVPRHGASAATTAGDSVTDARPAMSHRDGGSSGEDAGADAGVTAGASHAIRPVQATPRSSMPTWLAHEYTVIRDKLKAEISSTSSKSIVGIPRCYQQGRFDEGSLDPYLSSRQTFQVDPAIFYRPTWFVWLPHCLLGDRIPCPACKAAGRRTRDGKTCFLHQLGWPKTPRRVVDVDRCLYIVGYRYRCSNKDVCGHTYKSWSPAVLEVLPRSLAANFTFRLTFRSGLTDRLTGLLRDTFRVGVGAETFTSIIQAHHYRRHNLLHLQYLEMLKERLDGNMSQFMAHVSPFSAFSDRQGYAGFVPTATYFRKFYDTLIESWAPQIQQHISMLSAEILSVDHSFKAMKRLARVDGVSVFPGLHSTVNEYGEIRAMALSASKAHDQYIPILSKIPESLQLFGHKATQCVFTDNVRADKNQLEHAFPSLRAGVVPVPPLSDLPALEIPPTWSHVHLATPQQVNLRFNIIMNHRTANLSPTVAFDMEWPVDTTTGIHGRTFSFIEDGIIKLPSSLLTFLRSPLYRKVGVNISADFKRLHADCGFATTDPPFAGHFELGAMAVSRNAALRRNVSLTELVRNVLRRSVEKDPVIRVSTHWADRELLPEFIHYAALDVYAVWEVYSALGTMDSAQLVTSESSGGTSVALYAPDGRRVALGILALDRVSTLEGVKVTKSRSVMTVGSVDVPGFIHPAALCPTRKATPLATFGQPPFQLVVPMNMLRTCPTVSVPSLPSANSTATSAQTLSNPDGDSASRPDSLAVIPQTGPGLIATGPSVYGHPKPPTCPSYARIEAQPSVSVSDAPEAATGSVGQDPVIEVGLLEMLDSESTTLGADSSVQAGDSAEVSSDEPQVMEQAVEGSSLDPEAEAALRALLLEYDSVDEASLRNAHSRVLGDIFHLHHQFPISQHHGLRRPFSRALSAAIFIPDSDDKAAVEAVLQQRGTTYNSKLLSSPEWVLRRVRRHVPPPKILLPRVTAVIKMYGALKDSTTGQPLFNQRAWEIAQNVLENIRLGYYSDPPDLALYFKIGEDKYGLTLYRCCRGTNDVEGGVHQNLIRRFTSFNISPRHAVNSLLDYVFTHNLEAHWTLLQVGTMNRTGRKYLGHFDIPLKNHTAHLLDLLTAADVFTSGTRHLRGGWVNGDDYQRAAETFGIVRFSETTRQRLGMLPYSADFVRDQGPRHQYLSERQGTRFAVLPVHTRAERDLFHLLIGSTSTSGSGQPEWERLSSTWSGHADGQHIFYKLPEHLKAYYKTWLDFCNENNSLALNVHACQRIRALLRPAPRVLAPIKTAIPVPLSDAISTSVAITNATDVDVSTWGIHQLLARHQTAQFSIQYQYGDGHAGPPASSRLGALSQDSAGSTINLGRKRPALEAIEHAEPSGNPTRQPKRKHRTCTRCRSELCPGRWKVDKCLVPPSRVSIAQCSLPAMMGSQATSSQYQSFNSGPVCDDSGSSLPRLDGAESSAPFPMPGPPS
ncbi:hypothetical protein BN946_scf185015.g99 [Trametes cinnabarina]|uniref:3'-5' exonuclease n=1 Tax=Pycnoporus cinnabarinus TaxID=5643 RepID=A0A060SHW6_PYCCI|nr:hypothetical protein BN946_scf185015.g99 [Trametes cinnabarina]